MRFRLVLFCTLAMAADVGTIRGLIREGRHRDAIAACDRELQAAPRNVALLTLKGLALQGTGEMAAALVELRKALAIQPADEAALQGAAQIEFALRDPRARQRLEAVLRLRPNAEPAHAMLGLLAFEKRACAGAIGHFAKAGRAAEAPAIRWPYGVCLLDEQRWAAAAEQFAELLQLREHTPTRYNLALAHWNAKEFGAALAALAPLDAAGGDVDAMRLLASAAEAAGDVPRALAVLQRTISENPRDERLLVDLAVLCVDHKAEELGLSVVRAGLERLPESGRLTVLLGVLQVRRGEVEQGRAAFERAERLMPEGGLGPIGIASTLMQMGLAGEAAGMLREQLRKGADPRAELTLARALVLQGEFQEAARLLTGVLRREPGNAAAHGLLGKVYGQLGETAKANAELREAIRLDPTDRPSTYQLMLNYRKAGRTQEAAELARRVQGLLDKEKAETRFEAVRDLR